MRQGLDGHIDLERLRRIWMPISPYPYLDRVRGKRMLLVYARYDLTFPVDLSRMLVDEFRRRGIEHQLRGAPLRPLQHRRHALQVARRTDVVPLSVEKPVRTSVDGGWRSVGGEGREEPPPTAKRPSSVTQKWSTRGVAFWLPLYTEPIL